MNLSKIWLETERILQRMCQPDFGCTFLYETACVQGLGWVLPVLFLASCCEQKLGEVRLRFSSVILFAMQCLTSLLGWAAIGFFNQTLHYNFLFVHTSVTEALRQKISLLKGIRAGCLCLPV